MTKELLRQILNEVKDIKSEVSDVKNDVNDVKNEQQSMKNDLQTMKATQELMQAQLNETNISLESVAIHVNFIIGEVKEIKDNQEKQGKVLESLSLRSLEQETDIRVLKRNS